MLLSQGQMSDYKGAKLLFEVLPTAPVLLADRGYDADRSRDAPRRKGIEPCIPPRENRKIDIPYDKSLYKQRHKIKTCAVSQPAMTDVHTLSFPPSVLSLSLYGGFNES
uniref:Transposase IS4-like domain-containing protein n=1 Tax=Candidatus Kentrum sp. FW TaxID=2126338 RepID=A0A450TGB5_9GAMM|nr:MAG: hypothetical protein BECKFW1821B_GA0114236_11143 [Candidatus Kentron sp. FW]